MSNLRLTLLRGLLAFGLSFALWAFVSFSQNPEATVSFPDVQLEAIGLEPELVVVDANGLPTSSLPIVDITLSTDQRQLTQLRPVDVRAVVDLSGLGAGEHIVPVNVRPTRSNLSFNVPEEGVQPSAVPIRLEQLSSKQVPIDLVVSGNLPFSFERGEPSITMNGAPISEVTIGGPQSRVDRVTAVRARANIEQLRATYLAPLSLEAIDAGGTEIEGVTLTPTTVTVEIPIRAVVGLKLVPVEPSVVGLPASGFRVTGVRVDPPLIALAGSSGPLDAVAVLTTDPITIRGATRSQSAAVAIIFPEGTSPSEGEPDTVSVTIEIAPITTAFQAELPAQVTVTGLSPGMQYSASPSVVTLTLSGTGQALAALGQSALRATVDVSGLSPGAYQRAVAVALPDGVSLVGDPPVIEVTLRFPPAPTSPAPAPSQTTPSAPGATPGPNTTPEPTADADEPAASPTPQPQAETATPGATPTAEGALATSIPAP
jgi:YbbR domain-containing protein